MVLERVLVSNQHLVEHVALLAPSQCPLTQMWTCLLGRQGNPTPEAVTCYVQGRKCSLDLTCEISSGCCITFWLDQCKLSTMDIRIAFRQVILAFDWMDTHFFLPTYDLPFSFPFSFILARTIMNVYPKGGVIVEKYLTL